MPPTSLHLNVRLHRVCSDRLDDAPGYQVQFNPSSGQDTSRSCQCCRHGCDRRRRPRMPSDRSSPPDTRSAPEQNISGRRVGAFARRAVPAHVAFQPTETAIRYMTLAQSKLTLRFVSPPSCSEQLRGMTVQGSPYGGLTGGKSTISRTLFSLASTSPLVLPELERFQRA